MTNFVVNTNLLLARNFILATNLQFTKSPLQQDVPHLQGITLKMGA